MKALIVDDEAPARRELAFLLQAHPQIEIVAQVAKLAQAEAALRLLKPAVVFLDIHLMGENGFDLVPKIPPATRIVFVTADDTAAIRAIRINALDYLLKPIDAGALANAVRRLTAASPDPTAPLAAADRILLRSDGEQRFVSLSEIVALEAFGAYTRVHLPDGTRPLVLRALKSWEEALPAAAFLRIHRNAIVALTRVQRVTADGLVELAPGSLRLEASRRLLPDLRARLDAIAGEK